MKFSKFSELVNRNFVESYFVQQTTAIVAIMDVTIVVLRLAALVQPLQLRFSQFTLVLDWDSGKVLIFPSQPLTTANTRTDY